MLLTTSEATIVQPTLQFLFVVPGDQRWVLRSIRAICARDVGGLPVRAYTLVTSDGSNIVAAVGAADAGTEPGQCSITWANVPAAAVASGSDGIVVAPLGPVVLPAGYTVAGNIVGGAALDTWVSAVAWYDFVYTSTP